MGEGASDGSIRYNMIGEGASDGSIRYNRWERERVMEVFVMTDGRGEE